uniref:Uncharacterized protein n=1 Tax=Globisporangium ultimum (strain ATCC 200006 / CBS 805.95 / DAOM BR144) TaxID=431595 RepID=K3W9V0_GLOUD
MAPSAIKSVALAAIVSAAALCDSVADAHQLVILPNPTFTVPTKDERWSPLAFLENQGYKTTADFNAYYKSKGYKSLRAFMDDKKAYKVNSNADFECGYTNKNGARQPIPANFRTTGYTHDGPCEVWLDNTKVLSGSNCHKDFPGKTHAMSYAACKGSCTLRWYWMGIRFLKGKHSWQVYKECVPLGRKRLLEEESEFESANNATRV